LRTGRVAAMPVTTVLAEQRRPQQHRAARAVIPVRLAVDRVVGDFPALGNSGEVVGLRERPRPWSE
jgi:hypothetical protein